jgi:hypothetical protein
VRESIAAKSKRVKILYRYNLEESCKESYGFKKAVLKMKTLLLLLLLMMMMMMVVVMNDREIKIGRVRLPSKEEMHISLMKLCFHVKKLLGETDTADKITLESHCLLTKLLRVILNLGFCVSRYALIHKYTS